jgi:cytochrome c5
MKVLGRSFLFGSGLRVKRKARLRRMSCVPVAMLLAACGPDPSQESDVVEMPVFEDARLAAGRSVWMGTCRACHLIGVAGAPAVNDAEAWDERRSRGREALYQSALNGIRGEDGDYRMPPRGGNKRLSDEQVRQAVDYKLAAVEQLRANAP